MMYLYNLVQFDSSFSLLAVAVLYYMNTDREKNFSYLLVSVLLHLLMFHCPLMDPTSA